MNNGQAAESPTQKKFEAWAIVELFGHQRVAGKVSEEMIGGATLIRVDIPKNGAPYTRYFGGGAIYSLNPTTESLARIAANSLGSEPSYAWELNRAVQERVQSPALPPPPDGGQSDIFGSDRDGQFEDGDDSEGGFP